MNISIGSVFCGKYVIEEKLGEGSYGQVFKAKDECDGSLVAIKFAHGEGFVNERNIIERDILQLIRNSDSGSKRLVVDLKASVVLSDCVVMVMELLSRSLTHYINNGLIEGMDKISAYAKQMLEFLRFMDEMGIIHVDIKPDNILHDAVGECIKFADFGCSHCSIVKEKLMNIGTPYYMAPELLLGLDYGSAVDTWSTACVLVECLTKSVLFEGETELQIMQRIALIVGNPDQMVIMNAPGRNQFYWYDMKSKLFLLLGCNSPIQPIGLKNYLRTHHKVNVDEPKCSAFVDLVERMLHCNPCKRLKPQALLDHAFFADPKMEKLNEISGKMKLPKHFVQETMSLFEKIRNEEAIKGRDEVAVVATCLRFVCGKNNVLASFKNFSQMSGVDVDILTEITNVIKQIEKPKPQPCGIGSIGTHCAKLKLGKNIAEIATKLANKAIDRNVLRGNELRTVVAAAIFVAGRINKRRVAFKDVVKFTEASPVAMKACTRKLFPISSFLLKL